MSSLRLAVAGAGAIGRRQIGPIGANPACTLSAIVATPLATARDAARTLRVTLAVSEAAKSGRIVSTERGDE